MPVFKSNYHTHTTYCDGQSNPREIVEEAARLGMSEIGFSGHSYTSIDESYCMSRDGMQSYYDEIGRLTAEYGTRSGTAGPSDGGAAHSSDGSLASSSNGNPANFSDIGSHGLRVLRGIEMDYFSDSEDYRFDWDHIICSCHYIKKNGVVFPVDETEEILTDACKQLYAGDIYSLIADYYTEVGNVADVVRAGCISAESSADAKLIIGHFDLITKFNEGGRLFDESDPRYVAAWTTALDRLTGCDTNNSAACMTAPDRLTGSDTNHSDTSDKKSGQPFESAAHSDSVIFEINTGAMSRGYRTAPYPSKEILIEIARRGIPVVISSDSHEKSTLMYGFDEAEKLVEELGLNLVTL